MYTWIYGNNNERTGIKLTIVIDKQMQTKSAKIICAGFT